MRIIGISFVNSILILFVILIHKVLFRVLHFGYENLLFY
ncbi:bacteriocin-like WGxF protein [Listeria ivanovii]|nr:bacteriocin-like WGxF protein [Listeria ivanovii]